MPDFNRDVALAADSQGFVNRGQNGVALIAHVRGINAAELPCLGSESDQLICLGVGSGRVLQGSRQTDRAFAHGLPDERLHLIQLSGRRLLVVVSQHHAPDLSGAHVAGEVDSHSLFFQAGEVLPKRSPVRRDVIMIVA